MTLMSLPTIASPDYMVLGNKYTCVTDILHISNSFSKSRPMSIIIGAKNIHLVFRLAIL